MLVPGDLIQWLAKRWLVHKIDTSTLTAFVTSQDNQTSILGADEDQIGTCQVLCNPIVLWPCTTMPQKRRGRLVGICRATLRGEEPLAFLVDWVKMDDLQIGGSVFLNPELGLAFPDRLIAVYETGRLPVDIPRGFVPLPRKLLPSHQQLSSPEAVTPNLFAHLRDEDE